MGSIFDNAVNPRKDASTSESNKRWEEEVKRLKEARKKQQEEWRTLNEERTKSV